jgi:hypothetical protein
MLNWSDLMRQAQSNAGLDVLTRQFNLSDDQAQKAMLAFLPAFAMGMQHLMLTAPSNPLLQGMAGAWAGNPWQAAMSSQAQQNGKRLIDSLFGSDEASRRIAHRAADFTGLNVDLIQQMLPLMAGILAGTLHQMMTGQGRTADMFPAPAEAPEKAGKQADPWTTLWAGWAQAFPSKEGGDRASEERRQPPSGQESTSLPWQDMMQKGQEMQMQYLTSLQSILDEAWKSRKPEH